MPSYSTSLRLVQPATGEYPGSWGTQVNSGLTALVDTAVAGTANITMTAANYTLSTANGATDEARAMVLNLTGTPGAARNVICPAVSKVYIVYNGTTGGFAQTVKTSAGTGVVVPNGETKLLRCDGANVVNALTGDTVSIVDFGAAIGSVADQTAVIQSAVDAVNAAGGGDLYIPPGSFYVTGLNMKANVRLVGQARATSILKMFNTTTASIMINVDSVSNVAFYNLTVDLNNAVYTDGLGASAIYLKTTSTVANNLYVQNCDFIGGKVRPYIDYRASIASRGLFALNNNFIGSATLVPATAPQAQTSQALRFLCTTNCGNFEITGNTSQYCGRFIQIRHDTTQAFDRFDSVVVSNNIVTDILDDPNVSSSPYELFCITGLAVTGNTIRTGGRGFNATYVKGGSYTGNVAYDQTRYFMEIQSNDGLTISGNTAYNCKTFVNDTPGGVSTGSINVNIVGNTIDGGNDGEVNYDAYVFLNCITMYPTSTYSNWRVADNIFIGGKYLIATIRIDGTTNGYIIENNVFIQNDVTSSVTAIQHNSGDNVVIRNNVIRRTVNITDASYGDIRSGTCTNGSAIVTSLTAPQAASVTPNATTAIRVGNVVTGAGIPAGTTVLSIDSVAQSVTLSANYTGVGGVVSLLFIDQATFAFISVLTNNSASSIIIDNNSVVFTGTDARSSVANTGAIGIGGNTAPSSNLTKLTVTNNRISGNFTGTTGTAYGSVVLPATAGDTVYLNNDVTGVTGGSENLNAAIVYRRTKREYEGTASPTTGTYIVGDRVWNSTPAAGQPKSWVCTVAGTPGTWVSEGNL